MNIQVKYEVKKTFKDKNTNEIVEENSILDISVERMKELNKGNIGRVIDILVEDETKDSEKDKEDNKNDREDKYTEEKLNELNVNQLKELAEKEKIELTKAKKAEIISEILEKQK